MAGRRSGGRILLSLAIAVLLVGCGSLAGPAPAAQPGLANCYLQLDGHYAQIAVTGPPGSCQNLVANLVGPIGTWDAFSPNAVQPLLAQQFLLCGGRRMDQTSGWIQVAVYDAGDQVAGGEVCSRLGLPNRYREGPVLVLRGPVIRSPQSVG